MRIHRGRVACIRHIKQMAQRVYFNIEHTKYYGNHIFCSISAQFYKKQKNIPSVIIGEGPYAMSRKLK